MIVPNRYNNIIGNDFNGRKSFEKVDNIIYDCFAARWTLLEKGKEYDNQLDNISDINMLVEVNKN